MPASDSMQILLEHDKWATKQILSACDNLTTEQFAQKFEMGPGSLQATLTHMIAAMRAWTDTLKNQEARPRVDQDGKAYTPAQLSALLEETYIEFTAIARSEPVEQVVTRMRQGKEYKFTRGAIVTHVTTHGMHHRAQCLNMLRHLGVKPLPASSVAEWVRMVDFAA